MVKSVLEQMVKSLPLLIAFVVGSLITLTFTNIYANGSDPNQIHGCVKNSNGTLKIVPINTNCAVSETPLNWDNHDPGLPVICPGCAFGTLIEPLFKGKVLTGSYLPGMSVYDANLDGTIFSDLNISSGEFSNSSFIGAKFTGTDLGGKVISNSNFTDADFTNAAMYGGTDGGGNIWTGVIWSNTTCPDGTNSDNNGNTCVGHLSV